MAASLHRDRKAAARDRDGVCVPLLHVPPSAGQRAHCLQRQCVLYQGDPAAPAIPSQPTWPPCRSGLRRNERAALGSIAASAGLTAAKAVVGLLSGSLAILSEAAHSLLDLAATVLTYFAVRIADKPADREHQYGHGKVESVAALAETALLFLLCVGVVWEAAQRLAGAHGTHVEATIASFAVIAASVVIDFLRARVLSRTAAETSSQALEAD